VPKENISKPGLLSEIKEKKASKGNIVKLKHLSGMSVDGMKSNLFKQQREKSLSTPRTNDTMTSVFKNPTVRLKHSETLTPHDKPSPKAEHVDFEQVLMAHYRQLQS
jgi:hypothetical protein